MEIVKSILYPFTFNAFSVILTYGSIVARFFQELENGEYERLLIFRCHCSKWRKQRESLMMRRREDLGV